MGSVDFMRVLINLVVFSMFANYFKFVYLGISAGIILRQI